MSHSVDIFMPMFLGDYHKATTMLSCEEHGAYCLLLFSLWSNDGYLPHDMKKLSRICKLSQERFSDIWEDLEELFTIDNGLISNNRLCEELGKAIKRRETAIRNGKNGGRPRSENPEPNPEETKRVSETEPSDKAEANPEKSSSPSPSPSNASLELHKPALAPKVAKQRITLSIEDVKAECVKYAFGKYSEAFLDDFFSHWFSVCIKTGKTRYDCEKHFNIPQRMATALKNGCGRGFKIPTIEEVYEYNATFFKDDAPDISKKFHDNYSSKNWMKNNRPMDEWKYTFVEWMNREGTYNARSV